MILRHPGVEVHSESSRDSRNCREHEHHAIDHQIQRDNFIAPAATITDPEVFIYMLG